MRDSLSPQPTADVTHATPRETSIRHKQIAAIYCDAMLLIDEAESCFALDNAMQNTQGTGVSNALLADPALDPTQDPVRRLTIACETLQTTTRLAQIIAWTVNQRAEARSEARAESRAKSTAQSNKAANDTDSFACATALAEVNRTLSSQRLGSYHSPTQQAVIIATAQLYARAQRLALLWQSATAPAAPAHDIIASLQKRLAPTAKQS